MKVRWTPEAEDDRAQIFDYIVADSPRAAVKMDEIFSKSAARLADHPSSVVTVAFPVLGKSSRTIAIASCTRSSRTRFGCSP